MINNVHYRLLTAVAETIKHDAPNSAYVIDALAGAILCEDAHELRRIVQAWVKSRPEMIGKTP